MLATDFYFESTLGAFGYTTRAIIVEVIYITDFAQREGFVVMSIRKIWL